MATVDSDAAIELVVVGAHLTGMPLNRELTSRGGVFRRGLRTTADYRLFALAGGPPQRPGLLRVGEAQGASIDIEVWALPPDGFGRFVASIPAPLCIGTVRLADGSRPMGFLVEPEGLIGAIDITAHGGWRSYTTTSNASQPQRFHTPATEEPSSAFADTTLLDN